MGAQSLRSKNWALKVVLLTVGLGGLVGFVGPLPQRTRREMESVTRHAGADDWDDRTVLILGGGVIGVSISFHLAQRGVKSTVVDRVGIASCASGKAGGFLARDWNTGSATDELTRKSFDMHEEVAKELSLSSYRRLKCQSVAVDGTGAKPAGAKLKNLEWTDLGVRGSRLMGDESTIAQVHPKELCDAMWSYSEQHGSKFVKGVVETLCYEDGDSGRHISGVVVDGQKMAADVVILSMGPWGEVLQQTVPACGMLGVKYHSVLMRSGRVLNEAVFFSGLGDPEVYPRNDGDHYVTGFPDPPRAVKEIPGEVEVREEMCSRLVKTMQQVSSEMAEAEVTTKQSCYLPFTRDSVPVMGKVPEHENVFVATGHGCWGILLSLASGKAMSELILDGKVLFQMCPVLLGSAALLAEVQTPLQKCSESECAPIHERKTKTNRGCLRSLNVEVPCRYRQAKPKKSKVVRFTVESKPFGIDLDMVESDGDIYVVKVTPGSLAENAGICVGDKLWSAGGRTVRGAEQALAIRELLPPFRMIFQRG